MCIPGHGRWTPISRGLGSGEISVFRGPGDRKDVPGGRFCPDRGFGVGGLVIAAGEGAGRGFGGGVWPENWAFSSYLRDVYGG